MLRAGSGSGEVVLAKKLRVGVVQCALDTAGERNVARVESFVREAAAQGAQIIITPELFEGRYFPQAERSEVFASAHEVQSSPLLERFSRLSAELCVVLPLSFFEKDGPHYYNSVAVFDADGRNLGIYRKSHIPDGPGYEEKYYFRPGNTGFRVWSTRYGCLGVGICWDQWFPEAARAMALMGAELLAYPTAIGSEPAEPGLDTRKPWRRAMVGHAVSNAMPVVAANRIGKEDDISFYGNSFIVDAQGEQCAAFGDREEGCLLADFDLDAIREYRASCGFFRDRRPELYRELCER